MQRVCLFVEGMLARNKHVYLIQQTAAVQHLYALVEGVPAINASKEECGLPDKTRQFSLIYRFQSIINEWLPWGQWRAFHFYIFDNEKSFHISVYFFVFHAIYQY